jgi:hypothetical protein
MLSRHRRKDDALDRLSDGIAQLTSSERLAPRAGPLSSLFL